MHPAVARDVLRKGGWTAPEITMALRILAHDGARSADQVSDVIAAFARRSADGDEQRAWQAITRRLDDHRAQSEALWALRSFR